MDVSGFDYSACKDRIVFLVMIDGMASARFEDALNSGRLLTIKSLMDDRPSASCEAIGTFPSATAPMLPELFSGRFCDRFWSGPKKINAFDRLQKKALKYEFIPNAWDTDIVDIFDILQANGELVLSLFPGEFHAATATYHDTLRFGLDALGRFSRLEIMNYDKVIIEKAMEIIESEDREPRLVFLALQSVDLTGHFSGPDSKEYTDCLVELDKQLGRFLEFLKKKKDGNGRSYYDKATFFVFGDHGMVQSSEYIDLSAALRKEGIKAADLGSLTQMVEEKINPFWPGALEAFSVPGGSNISEVYIRKKTGDRPWEWEEFPAYENLRSYPVTQWFTERKVDIIGAILANEGVDQVLVPRAENVVDVHSPRHGPATIYRRKGGFNESATFAYQASNKTDPFGYLDDPICVDLVCSDISLSRHNYTAPEFDGHFYDRDAWARATGKSAYPGAPVLVPKSFVRHHTTSDIIVNARDGYNFSSYFKGDHGSLSRSAINTSLICAGEGISENASPENVMLIDMLPIILDILGVKSPQSFIDSLDAKLIKNLLK